ncbi:hypothetical protein MJH12_03175, partial [bacterium]|nr:hypothetical protein [bacterium]
MKDIEEIKDALVSLTNFIRDLIKLAKKHNIEAKLYNGEGIDIIYSLMGDARVTRWLTSICEEDLVDEDLWLRLMKFLEKELKVQQAKSLINRKSINPTDDPTKVKDKPLKFKQSFLTQNKDNQEEIQEDREYPCSFCGEVGHAKTNGPKGSYLVQYFACRKFVESTPAQRFRVLRSKGLCHQCLFPGAKQSEGKHSNGNCQSYYTCTHESHNKYPCKKHVLVCQDHSDAEENIQLLNNYKSKYVLNQKSIEEFSKNIKLSFHNSYKVSIDKSATNKQKDDDNDIITNSGIYILQTIKI